MSDEEDVISMTAIEAIKHVTEYHEIPSLYALSKALSDEALTIQPIQLKGYLNGAKMSAKTAKRFFDVYGIHISDIHSRGIFSK